jgi:Cupin-like domain
VQSALSAPADFAGYLAAFDNGNPVDAILMPPEACGRIAYNDAMDGFNFVRNRLPLAAILDQLSRYARFEDPPAVAVQSAPIADCLPGFGERNVLPVLDRAIVPRIWIGNRVTVPAHFDESQNLACVVAGRRRFTLFPPEQVSNLYVGPLDFAPTGAAMSMVRLAAPDFGKYPRFRDALAAASVVELGPGDAIFIPTLWWHHVESLDPRLNVLVNYWWNGTLATVDRTASGMDCLVHGLLSLKPMPAELREAWAALFDHYVFRASEDDLAHIPKHRRGVLAKLSPEAARKVRDVLIARLRN